MIHERTSNWVGVQTALDSPVFKVEKTYTFCVVARYIEEKCIDSKVVWIANSHKGGFLF